MPRSNKCFKKRKFCGNKHKQIVSSSVTSEPRPPPNLEPDSDSRPTPKHSASFTKLRGASRHTEKTFFRDNKSCTYVIIDLELLCQKLKEFAVCNKCGVGNVVLSEDCGARMGCAAKISLHCDSCSKIDSFMSSTKTDKGQYDINLRLVYALRSIGCGLEDGKMLCTVLDVPGPPVRFMKYNRIIAPIIAKVSDECMLEATKEVSEKTESTDFAVAVDGTWQKRGFTSLNGVVTVTSIETGKVLDAHVLSKYCQGCQLAKTEEKKIKHKAMCELNYDGSSGGMESAGATAIFCRSVMKRGVRYLTYLGDGDSKGHAAVSEAQPYGPGVEIKKAECIGHIQKRMGGRLRKLCKSFPKGQKLSDGRGLRGKNRLTDAAIDKLQAYYGEAIRRNCDNLVEMRRAIWAIYFHKLSTDAQPMHNLCPQGENSWCPYNRSKITGETYSHKHSLPEAVMLAIKPVFKDLSNETLLRGCLLGKTQNPNESFNGLIWKRVPKTVFSGIVTIKIGVYDAILAYNKGALSKVDVLKALGLKCSASVTERLQRFDLKRIREAEKKILEDSKKKRKMQRQLKRKREDAEKHKDYEPGMF